jgi:hypothetical protein
MSNKWSEIEIRTRNGMKVSRDTADNVLSSAENTWKRMGLTDRQIAFGMGLMDIESGFDSRAMSPSGEYYGLGQFKASTWEKAVEMYNKQYHTHISTSFTSDTNTQIAVLGNWIQQMLWPRAQSHFSDTRLNSRYSLEDVAYALHNPGYNSSTEDLRYYLDHVYRSPKPKQDRDPDDYEWMNEKVLPKTHRILGVPDGPPAGQRPGAATPQIPITPTKPRSSLESPQKPYRPSSLNMGIPGPAQPMAGGNEFSSPDISQGFPAQFADPFAQYADRGFSPLTENPYVPVQGGPARPNLLDAPSSFESLSFGSGSQPQVIAQPSKQPGGKNQVKAGQAKKALFYSLQDRLDFLGRVYRVAKPVSEATGLSLPFILAHAAHEVQFGKNIRENNLFSLKADKDWQGSTHLKGGNEYRSYPSYEESMKDYLGYLQANPRYGKMFEPVTRGSLGRLVDAIHYAGYSDDPLYGFRILAAAKDPIMKQALWQYQHWPPGDTPL